MDEVEKVSYHKVGLDDLPDEGRMLVNELIVAGYAYEAELEYEPSLCVGKQSLWPEYLWDISRVGQKWKVNIPGIIKTELYDDLEDALSIFSFWVKFEGVSTAHRGWSNDFDTLEIWMTSLKE